MAGTVYQLRIRHSLNRNLLQVSGIGTLIESQNVAFYMKSANWGEVDINLSLYIISGSTFLINKGSPFMLSIGTNGTTLSRIGGPSTTLPNNVMLLGRWHDLKFSAHGETGNATLSLSVDSVDVGSVPYGALRTILANHALANLLVERRCGNRRGVRFLGWRWYSSDRQERFGSGHRGRCVIFKQLDKHERVARLCHWSQSLRWMFW
jgi:hypothetical protein